MAETVVVELIPVAGIGQVSPDASHSFWNVKVAFFGHYLDNVQFGQSVASANVISLS